MPQASDWNSRYTAQPSCERDAQIRKLIHIDRIRSKATNVSIKPSTWEESNCAIYCLLIPLERCQSLFKSLYQDIEVRMKALSLWNVASNRSRRSIQDNSKC